MKSKNVIIIAVVAVFGILFIKGCSGYNGLVNQDESVKNSWNKVQSEYQRRSDLIPNLVSTVKGEANFEQTTLQNVIQARASATQVKIDPTNLTPEKIQQYQQAQGQLSQALGRLLMVTENYPTLRANEAFRGLQVQLEGTENRIKTARNDFNDAIKTYNIEVRSFPMNIFAGMFGFKEKTGFQAEAGAEKAPSVKF
jgi:LemA protein